MTRPISADRPSATPDTARSAGNDARIDDDVHQDPVVEDRAQAMVERILARHGTAIQAGAAEPLAHDGDQLDAEERDRKSTRLNSSHVAISYAVFCLKKKTADTEESR